MDHFISHTPEEEDELVRIIMEDSMTMMKEVVNDTSERPPYQTTPTKLNEHGILGEKKKNNIWLILGLGLLLVVVIVAVVLGALLSGGSDDDNINNSAPAPAPATDSTSESATSPSSSTSMEGEEPEDSSTTTTTVLYRPSSSPTGSTYGLMELLPQYAYDDLLEETSPQSRAFRWVANHREIHAMDDRRKVQLFALATLYYSWNGHLWLNGLNELWLDDSKSECDWLSNDYLEEWSLTGSSLSGGNLIIPTTNYDPNGGGGGDSPASLAACNDRGEFQVLNLRGVHDSTTRDRVPFPRELGLLTNLVEIDLSSMGLNASLSQDVWPALANLPNLQALQLPFNWLSGTIPDRLFHEESSKLRSLELSMNQLEGTIPSVIGLLTNLHGNFGLSNNRELTGSLPTQIGLCTNLGGILMKGILNLNGTMPSELGLLTKLTIMDVTSNKLTGNLPTELGLLTQMERIYLSRNDIHGPIPTEIGFMTSLERLYLRSNHLTGSIPSQLGLVTLLNRMDLYSNQLTGKIPTQIGKLQTLFKAWLNNNRITGSIPNELAEGVSTLVELYLDDNLLTGTIPQNWTALEFNSSTKPILDRSPYEQDFQGADFFYELDLSGNPGLVGTIPDQLCMMNTFACSLYSYNFDTFVWEPYTCTFEYDCTGTLCGCSCDPNTCGKGSSGTTTNDHLSHNTTH